MLDFDYILTGRSDFISFVMVGSGVNEEGEVVVVGLIGVFIVELFQVRLVGARMEVGQIEDVTYVC